MPLTCGLRVPIVLKAVFKTFDVQFHAIKKLSNFVQNLVLFLAYFLCGQNVIGPINTTGATGISTQKLE